MTATSFVKLAVVFSLLRNALGAPDVPSGAVVTVLAAILSAYVMAPVAAEIAPRWRRTRPRASTSTTRSRATAAPPCSRRSTRASRRSRRSSRATRARPSARCSSAWRSARQPLAAGASDLMVVLPAFLITELKEAFQIGLLVLLPFVVIDLVVASILLSLGMTVLAPSAVALPFKLLLFVLVDGWYVLSEALVRGYSRMAPRGSVATHALGRRAGHRDRGLSDGGVRSCARTGRWRRRGGLARIVRPRQRRRPMR